MLVLGLPHITSGYNEQAFAKFDHPAIKRAFHSGEFIAMKCAYHTFTKDSGLGAREMNWLTGQVKGSYKEIVLVRVDPNKPAAFKRIFFETSDILELLSLDPTRKFSSSIYSYATIASLLLLLAHVALTKVIPTLRSSARVG